MDGILLGSGDSVPRLPKLLVQTDKGGSWEMEFRPLTPDPAQNERNLHRAKMAGINGRSRNVDLTSSLVDSRAVCVHARVRRSNARNLPTVGSVPSGSSRNR